MTELKHCPCCGGENVTYERRLSKYDHNLWVKVMCWDCGCQTKEFKSSRGDTDGIRAVVEIARDRWNTRHVETCEVELRESGWGGYTRHCGACGADLDCDTRNKQNYCPSCGRKVEG